MSVKYNIIQKSQPGVSGGGGKKYYASAQMTGIVDIEELTRDIEKISTVNGADIRAVLYALVDVAMHKLADSNVVKLGDLGNLRITLKSNGLETPGSVNATAIKGTRIRFYPGKKLKEMQKSLTYQKVK